MCHKSLSYVLPDKQLIAQWRELCAIVGGIKKNGTPNHLLVNKVMWYNKSHFYNYCCLICNEMFNRGFEPTDESRNKIGTKMNIIMIFHIIAITILIIYFYIFM